MSAPRRPDATGRSSSQLMPKARKAFEIEGAFVPLRREVLASPAWRAMGINERRIIELLMISHMAHAGKENGRLGATFNQIVAFGVARSEIRKSIDRLEELGLVERTVREHRVMTRFRLTFLPARREDNTFAPPGDEWKARSEFVKPGAASRTRLVRKVEPKAPSVAQAEGPESQVSAAPLGAERRTLSIFRNGDGHIALREAVDELIGGGRDGRTVDGRWTQLEIARRAGVAQVAVSRLIREGKISRRDAEKIAAALPQLRSEAPPPDGRKKSRSGSLETGGRHVDAA
jgi:hypothetical protein